MNKTLLAYLRIAGLAVAWIAVAIATPVLFGHAINAHTNAGLVAAVAVILAGLGGLAGLTFHLFRAVRSL